MNENRKSILFGFSRRNAAHLVDISVRSESVALIIATNNNIRQVDFSQMLAALRKTSVKYFISTDIERDENDWVSLNRLMKNARPCDDETLFDLDVEAIAIVVNTSGSTGPDKLVCHSYRNIYKMFSGNVNPTTNYDLRTFSPMAFSWLGGSPLTEVFQGTTRVTMCGYAWKMDVEDMLLICEQEACNVFAAPHDILNPIVFRNLSIPKSIKCIICGGAPIPKHFRTLLDMVSVILCAYGSLEAGRISTVTIRNGASVGAHIGGKPLPGVEIKVVNKDGEIVPREEIGKIKVKTPYSFSCYLGEKNAHKNVWIDTEDTGMISEDGVLFVHGRQDDSITRGSFTSYSFSYERTIRDIGIPGMEDLVVVPVADKINYQEACACVIKEPGSFLTEKLFEEILDREMPSGLLKPKYVIILDMFPRTANGKIDRKKLIEMVMTKLDISS